MAQNNSINFNINFKVNDSGLKQARTALDQLQNLTNTQISIINTQTLDNARKSLNEATKQAGIFEEAMTKAFNVRLGTVNFERFKQELAESGTSIQNVQQSLFKLGPTGEQIYAKMAAGLMNVKFQTVETTTLLDKLGASLRKNILTFTSINIINKVRGSIGEAYGYVKNLDNSLNEIRIVTGKSADEMDRFAEKANKAAASLGKATTDYTKASTIFYQQGLSDTEVGARTDVTIKAANTTGQDTKTVADNLTALWNGFNAGAEEAEIYVDRLAALAATTASNLDELTTAMSKTASMANVMGVSEEQLAAQIATVVSVTRQAPESVGTAFKTIYARISDISTGAEDAETTLGNYSSKLAEMGINVLDSAGNLRDMGEVIEEVGVKWGNYSKEQQVAIAGIMGGQRQVNQVMALFDNWDMYTQSIETMADAEGTLQKQQDIYMESADGQLQKLRTEWEGVLDSLLKAEDIVKVAKSISPILQTVEKLVDAFGGGVGILQKFSPLLIGIVSPQISQGIGKLVNSFNAAKTNAQLAAQQVEVWNKSLKDTSFTDAYGKMVKKLEEDFVSLSRTMSANQKNELQQTIQNFIETTAPQAEKALNELNKAYEELPMAMARGFNTKPESLEIMIQEVDKLENKVKQLKDIKLEIKAPGNIGQFNNINKQIEQIEKLKTVYGNSLPNSILGAEKALKRYQNVMKNSASTDEQKNKALLQLQEYLKNNEGRINAFNRRLEQEVESTDKVVQKNKEYIKTLTDIRNQKGKADIFIDQKKVENTVNSIASMAQGVASLITVVQQFKNLGSIWDNEDLTAAEKIEQTLATLASIITVTAMAYNALKNAQIQETLASIKNVAIKGIQALASALVTKSKIAETFATRGLSEADKEAAISTMALGTAIKVAFPILAVIATVIVAIVIAIKEYIKANETSAEKLEKANKKLEESTGKFNEMKSAIEDYINTAKDLDKLEKGTKEYTTAIEELNKKVLDLISTYPELRKYLTIGDSGEFKLSKEGLEEYIELQKEALSIQQREVLGAGVTTKGDKQKKKDQLNKNFRTLGRYQRMYAISDWLEEKTGKQADDGTEGYRKWQEQNFAYEKWLKETQEADKKVLTGYLKSYEEFEKTSASVIGAVVEDIYKQAGEDGEKAKELLDNTIKMQQEVEKYERRVEKWRNRKNNEIKDSQGNVINNQFNFSDADIKAGNFSNLSLTDIKEIFNMDRVELADLMGVDTSDTDAINDFLLKVTDAYTEIKNLPSAFQTSEWQSIDLGIRQKFENIAGTIDDSLINQLGSGLEQLRNSTTINIEEFTTDLANLDFTQGEEGLEVFREKYGVLNEEIENYIQAQMRANTVLSISNGVITKLSSAMGKISTMKFGDMLSEKDYEELIGRFEGLSNYFQKVGDKYQYTAASNKKIFKELQAAYKDSRKQLEEIARVTSQIDISNITFGDYSTKVGSRAQVQSAQNQLKELDSKSIAGQMHMTEQAVEELINKTYLSENEFIQLQTIIKETADSDAAAYAADMEMIYATVQSEEELNHAVQDLGVSQKAVDDSREIIHRRELERLEEERQATLNLIKSDEEYKRSQEQKTRSKIEKRMETAEGTEWIKLYQQREESFKKEEASLNHQKQAQIELLNQQKARTAEQLIANDVSDDAVGIATALLNKGETWEKIQLEINKLGGDRTDDLNKIKSLYDIIIEEIRGIKTTEEEINQLYEDRLITINKTNSGLKESWEIQKNASQRRTSKIEDRIAHATGQEWLDLYNQKQDEKKQYKGILNTEYTNINTLVGSRKTELEGVAGFSEYITYDENNLATLKEGAEVNKDLVDKAQEYNDALKERIELGYEIEDLDKEQYITIDKKTDANRALTNSERELVKLQKQQEGLTSDALTENLKQQKDLQDKIIKQKQEQIKLSKEELKANQDVLEGLKNSSGQTLADLGVTVKYDETGGVSNIVEILNAVQGTDFAESVQEWINKINDSADATQDLQDAFEEAARVFTSFDYDEETRKKSATSTNEILKNRRDLYDPTSPEYKELSEQINKNSEEYLANTEKAYNDFIIEKYIPERNTKIGQLSDETKNKLNIDENDYITNVEDFQAELNKFEKRLKKGEKLTEEEENRYKQLKDEIPILQAINTLADIRVEKEVNLSNIITTRVKEQSQAIADATKNDIDELNKQMDKLKTEQGNLYGDNLVANLQAQADLEQQIVERLEKQVEERKELTKQAEEELGIAKEDLDQKGSVKINGKAIKDMTEEEREKNRNSGNEEWEKLIEVYEKSESDYADATAAFAYAKKQEKDAIDETNKEKQKEIQLNKDILKTQLKTAEDAIKRETTAQHELATQLKETDRAIQLVKKDQEGLSGPALIAKLKEEIALQQEKKEILEQQLEIINNQIKQMAALYSDQLFARFGVNVNFQLDSTGVSNLDSLYGLIQKLPIEQQGEFNELLQQAITSLNGLSSSAASTQSSIDSMTDSIDSLNKKIKDTEQAEAFRVKEEKWYLEEQAIKKVSRALAELQRIQKHLTGNALIANLTQQQKLLEKQAEAQKRKLDVMKGELLTMQAMLALQGVMFTNDGLIANYAEVVAKGNDKLNGYLKSYQSLYDQVLDLEDSIEDTIDKQLDLEYEKAAERLNMFNAKVDVELDLGKAKREWQSFKREFLNTLNGLEQLNDSIAEKAKQNILDLKDISGREVSLLTDHVNEIMNEIHIMQAGGWSDLYGTDQKAALDDLANYRQQLQDSLQSVADKIKEVEEAYLEQAQKIKSKFDDQLDNYGQIQSIIEHDMNLIKLLRGENSYDELANYYDKSTQNYEAQIGFLRNQVDYWKKLMDQAQPGSKEWEEFQANWKNSLASLNSAVDAAIQNLIDKYENAINSIMEKLEKAFTGGTDLSYMKQLWDWQNQEADLYLDKIAQEYNIQKLTYKYQEAANNAVNPTQRAKILKIMDEELEKLKEKDKLTKYDVERAEKIYDLRMKQLELEDESQNKTSMRLRRDAEGNYRYEYVADQDKVAELKQEILDMEESIRQFDLDSLREKKEEAIQIIQDFNDQARELTLARLKGDITEEEYNERMNNLVEHFNNIYNASAEAIDNISNNLRQSTLDEMLELEMLAQEALEGMTNDAIETLIQDISPIYNDTINQMIDRIAGAGGFISITSSAMESLKELFADFNAELREIEEAAGVSFSEIINGIDGTIDEMQALIEDNDELLNQYEQELDVIASLIDELHSLEDAYRDVYDAAMDAVDAALELRETQMNGPDYGDVSTTASAGGGAGSVSGSSAIGTTGTGKKTSSQGTKKSTYVLLSDGTIAYDNNGDLASYVGTEKYINANGIASGTKYKNVQVLQESDDKEHLKEVYTKYSSQADLLDPSGRNLKLRAKIGAAAAMFASGGYTGEWGADGKFAVLHEKELVLNQDDTANILQAVREVRASQRNIMADTEILSILSSIGDTVKDIYSARIDSTADAILSSVSAAAAGIINNSSNMVTNNINANFPNAGNMNEIRNAIMNLPNYASQKVHTNSRMNTTKSTYTMSK